MYKSNKVTITFFILFAVISIKGTGSYAQTGSELFMENRCARCHTIGRGRFVGPDLYGISQKYNKQQIMAWILNPEIIYSQTNRKPYNPGYPPMPNIGVNEHFADLIAEFLLNNDIKEAEKDSGTIDGSVIEESTGKEKADVDIYLKSYIGDRLTGEKLQISDSNGNFKFDNLSWVNSYSLTINYEGLEYETAKMVFPPDKETINLRLPLFGKTEDDSEIFLNLNHEIISVGDKRISVAEIYDFENRGNSIYIGKLNKSGERETLKFSLPDKAIGFSIVEGLNKDNVKRDKNMFYDTSGFPPGNKRVVLTYDIPAEFGTNVIKKELFYDVSNLLLLIDDGKNKTTVSTLNELEPVTIENVSYQRWAGIDLEAGSNYEIEVINKSADIKYINIYPVLIFAFIFLAAVIFVLITRKEKV